MLRLNIDKREHLFRNSEVRGLKLANNGDTGGGETPTQENAEDETFRERDDPTEEKVQPKTLGSNAKEVEKHLLCNKKTAILKVFMYDLPPEFHFGMMDTISIDHIWPRNMSQIPRYPGGLNLQHSPEYWLTLDLLSSIMPERSYPCTAILVKNPREADVYFVPYFSSLSYNKYSKSEGQDRNVELQEKLVQILLRQDPWRRSGGRDHVILMHHPNSLHVARERLSSATFIVADFGRYPPQVANAVKDVVAPYLHMVPTFKGDNSTYVSRKTLLYFRGAIFRKEGGFIRQQLYEMLKDEPSVHFSNGTTQKDGIRSASRGMRSSKFCLHLAGDTPSSNRLFDAIVSHCVPVIISDEIELPFEAELDYTDFCLFVKSADALRSGFLIELLRSKKELEWTRMWNRLKMLEHHFEYQFPTQPDDAVNMIWKNIAFRMPSIKQFLNKTKRRSRSRLLVIRS